MRLLKTRRLINALPFIAIAAMIGLIVYYTWQQTLQSRPDYDNPNAAPGRYSVKVTETTREVAKSAKKLNKTLSVYKLSLSNL